MTQTMGLRIQDSQAVVDGELTIYSVAALAGKLQSLGPGPVDVDLSGVTDIDTAGLQWMLMAKRCPGLSVRFIKHSPAVLQLLELSNLAAAVGDPLVLPCDPAHF